MSPLVGVWRGYTCASFQHSISPRYDVYAQTHLMFNKQSRVEVGGVNQSLIRVEVKERSQGELMHDDLLDLFGLICKERKL